MPVYAEPYFLYTTYIGLKSHFTTIKYDFLKYQGKVKQTFEAFNKRTDSNIFRKLASMIEKEEILPFLIAQFVENQHITPAKILEQPIKAQKNYTNWLSRIESVEKTYKEDLFTLAKKSNGDWRNVLRQENVDYPLLFKLVSSRQISPETYCLLDTLFHQTEKSYQGLEKDTLFKSLNLKYRKYRGFLDVTDDDLLVWTPRDLSSLLTSS